MRVSRSPATVQPGGSTTLECMADNPGATADRIGVPDAQAVLVDARQLIDGLARQYAEVTERLEHDGAPLDRLVEAQVAVELLPGAVTVFPAADMVLVRVLLGESTSDAIEPVRRASAIADDARRNGWEMMSDAQARSVWIAVREGTQLARSAFLFSSMLSDHVALVASDRVAAARAERTERLVASGLREVVLPVPIGTPDERWALWSSPAGDVGVPAAELVRTAASWRLLALVPEDIEGLIHLARLLYIFGWERWEFFTVAEQQGLVALQAAQELAFDTWLELEAAQVTARQRDGKHIALDDVARRCWALRRVASARGLRDVRAGLVRVPRSTADLPRSLAEAGLLTMWEASRSRLLFAMRNEIIHSPFAQQHPERAAVDVLDQVVELINELWYRLRATGQS